MKYAEITVIFNLNAETIYNRISRVLGNENETTETDTIIILFEDGTISDVKKEYRDKKFLIGPRCPPLTCPLFFTPAGKSTLFAKRPAEINGRKILKFNDIFFFNPTFIAHKKVSSVYNMIYETCCIEVFAIMKIASSDTSPRYLLAYHEDYFHEEDVIYLVNHVFSSEK